MHRAISKQGVGEILECLLEHEDIDLTSELFFGRSAPSRLYGVYNYIITSPKKRCFDQTYNDLFPRVLAKATRDARSLAVVLGINLTTSKPIAFNQKSKRASMSRGFKHFHNSIVDKFLTYLKPAGRCQCKEHLQGDKKCCKYIHGDMISVDINNEVMVLPQNRLYLVDCLEQLKKEAINTD